MSSIEVATVDLRELKALELAARSKIVFHLGRWLVPSQGSPGTVYRVELNPPSCNCEDFQLRSTGTADGDAPVCKHVIAARLVCARDHAGAEPEIVADAVPKKKQYPQNWALYDLAQQTEKDRFMELLADLVAGIEEPARAGVGRKPTKVRDMLFAAALKVFTTLSGRRFACDLKLAHERGFLSKLMNSMSAQHYIEEESLTPVLVSLIERSAHPLRCVDVDFASDSTGFSTSRFVRWYDEKYGVERSGRAWVKAHIMTGTKTNIITAAIIDGPTAGDSPQFKPLLETTVGNGFKLSEVSADKAYLSRENLELVTLHGGTPFIPFKSNSVAGTLGGVWEKMFGYFQYRREEFLRHYHKRSNVESTFSMVKAKFQDAVRSKTDTAMKNECLLKFLCHNIVVVHSAIIELGIEPVFWPTADDAPRSVLPMRLRQNEM